MDITFSKSALLVLQNWDVVREIHKAEAVLDQQLRGYLFAIDERLKTAPWWDADWVFIREADNQVYISRNEWKRGDQYAIWIGVEGFNKEGLFGTESMSQLYVWVSGNRPALVAALRDALNALPDVMGEVQAKAGNSYVVKSSLRKCLPAELDRFDEIVGTPLVHFFNFYGPMAIEFSRHLKAVEQ